MLDMKKELKEIRKKLEREDNSIDLMFQVLALDEKIDSKCMLEGRKLNNKILKIISMIVGEELKENKLR